MARASQARRLLALVFTVALTLSACGGFDTLAWRTPEAQGTSGIFPLTGTAPLMLPAIDTPNSSVVSAQSAEPLGSGHAMG